MSRRPKKVTKADCAGCRDDFYNHAHMGLNVGADGVPRCWQLADAVMVRTVEVHINQPPPYRNKPKARPACYRRSQFVYLSPDHPQVVKP